MKQVKTTPTKKEGIVRDWHFFDANDQVLGRLATQVSALLIGKHKSNFAQNINVGDKVVVTNASKIAITRNKLEGKIYKHYTGYPGGVKEETLGSLLERKPEEVIKKAVWGMLPTNKLRKERMKNLMVYAGEKHPHEAQKKGKK